MDKGIEIDGLFTLTSHGVTIYRLIHLHPVSAGSVVSVSCAAKYESRPRRYAGSPARAAWSCLGRVLADFCVETQTGGSRGTGQDRN